MKLEILVIVITGFFIFNTYHDGKYIEMLKSWKKYYKMIGIGFAGLSAYLFLKKYPNRTQSLISSVSGLITHLPIDRESGDLLQPFIQSYNETEIMKPQMKRIIQSGGNNNNKRSVSETKKKYVAANQDWKCGKCRKQLPAWFEVDHKIRLDSGGTNHVDNLIALCRNCHGEKTALENF